MELILEREYHPQGVNGLLRCGRKKICLTIERPWLNNRKQVSCIPEGRYVLERRYTKKFGWHCLLPGVPGRTGILIHSFNNALEESQGCIGPVMFTTEPGRGSLSRDALRGLMNFLDASFDKKKPIFLTIKKKEDEINSAEGSGAHAEVL